MKVTVEQIDRQREEELIVRCHDPGAAWVEGVREAASGQRTVCVWREDTLRLLKLSEIFYFEVVDDCFFVYTQAEVFEAKEKLYSELVFSPSVEAETRQTADNPKRRLRNARKRMERSGIGTKSQQALQLQREEMKTERRQISREQRDADAQRRFDMKQMKKKEKRRGH